LVGVPTAHRDTSALRGFSLDRAFPAVAVLPTFVVMLCIFGIPLLFSLYLSLTGWALDQALMGGRFVGLANYEDLLNDPAFVGSLESPLGTQQLRWRPRWHWAWPSRCSSTSTCLICAFCAPRWWYR
jgi:hypothetical protein